ncbi:MAG: hypothetical protein GY699_11565 [Desulfobacteraceae bacterium]|nr:hypothetical protein [Desulfobacteraceae bacterium]
MKGIVFNMLEDLIIEKFGEETIEEIYSDVKFSGDVLPFISPETYPDSDLFTILDSLVQKTSIPVDDLIFEFGKFMFPVFFKKYPVFFENIISPIEFLKSVNDIIHVEVKKFFENATPPTVIVKQLSENKIALYYKSERKLCKLLEGLLEGTALHFNKKISYVHKKCMKNGEDQCEYEIKFS